MTQRILVFENDPTFADEVKSSFERMGAQVQVAADGPSGLELAAGNKPDLILLTIELPGMNGFLVCKKIKKTVELEHVPLVILSSEVDEETFEQHKKLRTRADDYIRKPIAFADLLERVKSFVVINGTSAIPEAVHEEDHADAISVADHEVIALGEDDTRSGDTDVGQHSRATPLAAAGDLHLDGLDVSSGNGASVRPIASVESAYEPVAAGGLAAHGGGFGRSAVQAFGAGAAIVEEPAARGHAARSGDSSSAFRSPLAVADGGADVERFRRELGAMEEKVQSAERRAVSAEQRATASEKALDAAKRTGGVSSRELLDMREQLNRKERELLDLRGQVTARDKQLIEASDNALVIERDLQDTRDKQLDLQRELDKKNEVVLALTADKEASKKRLDDARGRIERNEGKVKELGLELDEIKATHDAELEGLRVKHTDTEQALRAEHAAAISRLSSEHETVTERAGQEFTSTLERTKQDHARALTEQRQEHATELERTLLRTQEQHAGTVETLELEHAAELEQTRQESAALLGRTRQEHASVLEKLQQEHAGSLDRLRQDHAGVLDRAKQDYTSVLELTKQEHASALERLAQEHASTVASLRQAQERASQQHVSELAELQQDHASTSAQLKDEHASALVQLKGEHASALARLKDDHAGTLERTRQEHAGVVERTRFEHTAELEARQREYEEQIAELREEHGVAQKVAADAAEQDKRAALAELTATYDAQIRDLRAAQDAERDRLNRKHSAEVSELSDKHRQDLARLGRSLSEAEARHALLEEQKEESESSRFQTEQSLVAMTSERDQHASHGVALSSELERFRNKLARDEETLARVQKAMAIGLGLLEERKADNE